MKHFHLISLLWENTRH